MNQNQKNETILIYTNIGEISVYLEGDNITSLRLDSNKVFNHKQNQKIHPVVSQILSYTQGIIDKFELPIMIQGTDFETTVLKTIMKIPYGVTWTYKELAEKSGYPNAVRAVGTVCRKNKIPIIIPCHRVIRSDGTYGNYVFGSDIKKRLIEFEINHKFY